MIIPKSNNINTLAFSGGGNSGIVYLAVLKYLTDNNIITGITKYYGVSVGSITALAFALDYNYNEAVDLFTSTLNFNNIINLDFKKIFNITKTYGIDDGSKLENVIKTMISLKGYSPYITFKQLYEKTNKKLYIGATAIISNKFILFSNETYPDMQVWRAIRMSCSIPLIFTPIKDDGINDYMVDGGVLNNLPINIIVNNILDNTVNNDTPDDTVNNDIARYKYNCNFLCFALSTRKVRNLDINNISFIKYIELIATKIFSNQSYHKEKYEPYILRINCSEYNLGVLKSNISKTQLIEILDDVYNKIDNIFNNKITNTNIINTSDEEEEDINTNDEEDINAGDEEDINAGDDEEEDINASDEEEIENE